MIRKSDSTRAILAGLAILLIGTVAGVGLDRTILIPAAAHASAAAAQHRIPQDHDEVLASLSTHLELTPPQSAQVREILSKHQAAIDEAWAQVHQDLQAAFAGVTTDVEALLDAEQVQRLHAWLAERHSGIRGHGNGHRH